MEWNREMAMIALTRNMMMQKSCRSFGTFDVRCFPMIQTCFSYIQTATKTDSPVASKNRRDVNNKTGYIGKSVGVQDPHVVNLWRSMALFSHGKQWPADISDAISCLSKKLEPRLPKRSSHASPSHIEQRYGTVLSSMIRESKMGGEVAANDITMNENIFGFEADIVYRPNAHPTNTGNRDKRIINIEIDGIEHDSPKTQRYDMLRDKYLTEKHGVVVVRIKLDAERKRLTDAQLRKNIIGAMRKKLQQ